VWLLLRRPAELDEADRAALAGWCAQSDDLAAAHRLSQEFLRLVRERRGTELAPWEADVQASGPEELRAFARGLRRDCAAVVAGLTVSWSSGPVEGHVNRLQYVSSDGPGGPGSTCCGGACSWRIDFGAGAAGGAGPTGQSS
jgi:transposase